MHSIYITLVLTFILSSCTGYKGNTTENTTLTRSLSYANILKVWPTKNELLERHGKPDRIKKYKSSEFFFYKQKDGAFIKIQFLNNRTYRISQIDKLGFTHPELLSEDEFLSLD